MINDRVCQLCGCDPGTKKFTTEYTGSIVFCYHCACKVEKWAEKNGRSGAVLEINLEIIQYAKMSPVRLLRGMPNGRPKKNVIFIQGGKILNA